MKDNIILEKSFEFALEIIKLYKVLLKNNEFVVSKQLLKSGTSIGANVEEGIAAQSRKDFISKISIASKEARETRYWLRLLDKSQFVDYNYSDQLAKVEELVKLLTAIVKSSKSNV